jgi:hypothetical protein
MIRLAAAANDERILMLDACDVWKGIRNHEKNDLYEVIVTSFYFLCSLLITVAVAAGWGKKTGATDGSYPTKWLSSPSRKTTQP